MRDHDPVVISQFNGLWARGDADSCPLDHFTVSNNIEYIQGGFKTRRGIEPFYPIGNVLRIYPYTKSQGLGGQDFLILTDNGDIYDSAYVTVGIYTPILSVTGMTDFGFTQFSGRAYITPCDGQFAIAGEFVYVYLGDNTPARKAGGTGPVNADGMLSAANSGSPGDVEAGIHIFAAVYETNTGFLTNFGPNTLPTVTAPGGEGVDLTNIPVSSNPYVVNVHLVATKLIDPLFYTGNTRGYEFFFIPGAIVTNGTTTLTVSFFDIELLEDASHLEDLYSEIPAGVALSSYHNRMVLLGAGGNGDILNLSEPGEPEAFNQIDGLIDKFTSEAEPLTAAQEYRDVLYTFKQKRTFGVSDNGDIPATWPVVAIDQGIGSTVHGISFVLDSGGVSIDFLVICNYSGILIFNGAFLRPELSWKIRDFILAFTEIHGTNPIESVQVLNDSIYQILYLALPDGSLLVGNYSNGLDPKNIRWGIYSFDVFVTTIGATVGNLIIGSNGPVP